MKNAKSFWSRAVKWPITALILGILFGCLNPLEAQRKERTRLRAYFEKIPNRDKKISVILTEGRGKNMRGVPGGLITVSTVSKDSTIILGTITTDSIGETVLMIAAEYPFPVNDDLYSLIGLTYEGNDSLRGSDKVIEFMDLQLAIAPTMLDSVKNVEVSAYVLDQQGDKVPVQQLEVKIGVKRLYNNLYLGELETDQEGKSAFEFPDDIPGDSDGNITLGVVVQDHDDFGTVSTYERVDWGVAVDYTTAANSRSLFGDSAPIWMITIVGIILVGAWFHFLWAVYLVVMIKKKSLTKG